MRLAVLGCGSIGRRHLRNLLVLGESDLVAFDPDPQARAAVEAETGIRCCCSLEQIWEQKPAAVLVTAPTDLHVPLALEAAGRGCHLFVEKPLSHTLQGLDELSAEIDRRGLVSMVACNMRFHPGPAAVKRLLEENAIGAVIASRIHTGSYLPEWRPGADYRSSYSASAERGGGAILDCIHEIDLALWYFGPGRLIAAASVPADSIGLEVEGLAELLIRHDSGVLSSVHLNFVQRDYRRGCQVIGTDGTLTWDFKRGSVWRDGPDGESRRYDQTREFDINDMYLDELRYFLGCARRQTPTFSSVQRGRAALDLAISAKRPGAATKGQQEVALES